MNQWHPIERGTLKQKDTEASRPRHSGTDLILDRHLSTRGLGGRARISYLQKAHYVDWAMVGILSFVVFCFVALAFAAYVIWAKAQGTTPF